MQSDDGAARRAEARDARRRLSAPGGAARHRREEQGGGRLVRRRRAVPLDRFRVSVSDENGRALRAGGLVRWLARVAPRTARGTVSVAIVPDKVARALNRRYRGCDYATDVLSFPPLAGEDYRRARHPKSLIANPKSQIPNPCPDHLGDIVIARGVAERQASEAGHSEQTELRVLALHGLLHLLGYDHEADTGQMAALERRLRRKGGLPHGLTERTRVERREP